MLSTRRYESDYKTKDKKKLTTPKVNINNANTSSSQAYMQICVAGYKTATERKHQISILNPPLGFSQNNYQANKTNQSPSNQTSRTTNLE